MKKITIIFIIVVVSFSAFVLIHIYSRQKPADPLGTMKKVLTKSKKTTKEKTLKIDMKLADIDELYRSGVYDKFKNLMSGKKAEEHPVLLPEEFTFKMRILTGHGNRSV